MVGRLSARGDFADHGWGDGVGRCSASLRGLPPAPRRSRGSFVPPTTRRCSPYKVPRDTAAVSDASHAEASRRLVGTRGRGIEERWRAIHKTRAPKKQ